MSSIAPTTAPVFRFAAQPLLVRRAAVLGAGTMGSRIAAHLANAGIPSLLLDMVPAGEGSRNRLAEAALAGLTKAKPAAFYEASLASMITPGNFEDDLPKLEQCDWVIEAVAENLEIKRALLERVTAAPGAEGGGDDKYFGVAGGKDRRGAEVASGSLFRDAFLQSAAVYAAAGDDSDGGERCCAGGGICGLCGSRLGKQVVFANDTPNFIANRIGVVRMFTAATLMLEQGLTIEEVDALTGPALGLAADGDISAGRHGGDRHPGACGGEFSAGSAAGRFRGVLQEIVKRGWLGDKIGAGVLQEDARRRWKR